MYTAVGGLKINGTAKTGRAVDLSDYSTLNFADVTVLDNYIVRQQDGTVVSAGTIDISGGDTESASFAMPLDVDGNILPGTYTIEIIPTFTVTNFAVSSFDGSTETIQINGVNWVDIFDEPGQTNEVITLGSAIPANNATADVDSTSLVGSDTLIVGVHNYTTEDPTTATISFTVTYNSFISDIYTFTVCDIITPTATVTSYCNTTQFGQIIFEDTTELTTGQVLDTRLWNISYPGNLVDPPTPADVTSALPSVTIPTLATGTWTWRLTYSVTVTQTDGLVYTYTASSIATEVQVECLTTLCELRCGINKLHEQWAQALNGGATNNEFSNAVALVNSYWIDATNAINCGDQSDFDFYAGLILDQLTLKNVNCDCGCSGESTATGNHWINNAGFESQTQIATLIADVDALEVDMAAVQADIADLQVDYQIFAAFAATNVTGSQPNSLSIPAQFFGTYQGVSGYIRIKFSVYDPFGATITIRDVTTGADVFSYVLAAATLVTFDLLLQNDGSNLFNLFGTRLTSAPAYAFVNQSGITNVTIVPNSVNILKFNSTTGSTLWLTAEITGIKIP